MDDELVQQTRVTYDRVAVDYDRRSQEVAAPFEQFRARFAADVLAIRGPVADLGCGPGRDLAVLRAAGLNAVGIDLSGGMLAVARHRDVPVVQGDLREPPLQPGSLAGLWSSAALLHVPRPEVAATLTTWHGLLRLGGRLGLSTSLGGQDGWELVPYAGEGPAGGDLHRWFVHHDQKDLTTLLEQAGFTITSVEQRTSHRTWSQVRAVA